MRDKLHFARAVGWQDEDCGDVWLLGTDLQRSFDAKYKKGSRERVGHRRVWREHGGRQDLVRRPASARIDDVPVPATLEMKKLVAGSRRSQRPVAQP